MPFFKFRLGRIKPHHSNLTKVPEGRPGFKNVLEKKVTCISGIMVSRNYHLVFAFDPVNEVLVGVEILKSLGLAQGPMVIACPTCGRTQIDVETLARKVEEMVSSVTVPITIAVMGCVVNGPGEARDADIGVAGGRREGRIFIKGKPVAKVPEEKLLEVLWTYIQKEVRGQKETNGKSGKT